MKLKLLFLINALLEGLGGLLFTLRPEWFLNNKSSNLESILLSKLFAFSALIFGLLSFQMYKHFEYNNLFKAFVLIFTTYHIVIALQLYRFYITDVTPTPSAFILHFAVAIAFAGLYLKEKEKFLS